MFFYWQGFGESWKTSKACFLRNIQLRCMSGFLRKRCMSGFLRKRCMSDFLQKRCMSDFLRKRCMLGFLLLFVNKAKLYLQTRQRENVFISKGPLLDKTKFYLTSLCLAKQGGLLC
jgi:hypothetical protein